MSHDNLAGMGLIRHVFFFAYFCRFDEQGIVSRRYGKMAVNQESEREGTYLDVLLEQGINTLIW